MMKAWNMDLCFGTSTSKIHKFGVEIPFSEKDIPIIDIFVFTEEDLKSEWLKIPDQFKIDTQMPILAGTQKRCKLRAVRRST